MIEQRIFRVPGADYMHEWETALDAHRDAALAAVHESGFTAVWVRGILRELVATTVFPELTPLPLALPTLQALIARCQRHGLRLFLYLNEPLGFPADHPFWTAHPDCRGVAGSSPDDYWDHSYAMCTSAAPVRAFLREAAHNLFAAAPGLGGAFLITASEHHTHCFSHNGTRQPGWQERFTCDACARRGPAAVIGEVVDLIREGAQSASPGAEIIAWNWSWSMYESDPQPTILAALPEVAVMADFERGGTRRLQFREDDIAIDREIEIDEYSLAYAGPSARFTGCLEAAAQRHLPVYAKLQLGTTHEIATVPNLPLIPRLHEKIAWLRRAGVHGILGSWNFGCEPTLNTYAAGRLMDADPDEPADALLQRIADEYFPGCDAGRVVAAWRHFCAAMEWHPFSMAFIYFGPVNAAPVWPWRLRPTCTPLRGDWYVPPDEDAFGDRLEDCCGPFAIEEVAALLAGLATRWEMGVAELAAALATAGETPHVRDERRVARMIGHQFRSAAHLFRFHRLRGEWQRSPASAAALIALIDDERQNLDAALPLIREDRRLGFHAGSFPHPHRFYDANSVERQLARLTALRHDLMESTPCPESP